MGSARVRVAISNPGHPERRWEALFLVDARAMNCYAPAKRLRETGIVPSGKRAHKIGDGSEVTVPSGVARVEFMGEMVGATVLFGDDNAEPVLGLTALESAGIEVDPRNQRLKRRRSVRLKPLHAK